MANPSWVDLAYFTILTRWRSWVDKLRDGDLEISGIVLIRDPMGNPECNGDNMNYTKNTFL